MGFYIVDKSQMSDIALNFGHNKCVVTCDCGDLKDCPQLHIQTDEFINDSENENYVYGLLISSKPPTVRFWHRVRNAWRMILGKEILWPDSMYVGREDVVGLRNWLDEVIAKMH